MASSIPPDVIWEILSPLGVKDLLRFKCVSKFFDSLTESPDFIKLHLSRYNSKNIFGVPKHLPCYPLESLKISRLMDASAITVNRPPCFGSPSDFWEVVGSCNGLIALFNKKSRRDIVLWNPFTGKSKKVESNIPCYKDITYGFGYDPEIDDYKLVMVSLTSKSKIYSLKTNSWRDVDNNDWSSSNKNAYFIKLEEAGVLANNALHWMVRDNDFRERIIAFDLVKEEICFLPVLDCGQFNDWVSMSVLDGCLVVTSTYENRHYVWVMKMYGVKESWTEVFSYLHSKHGDEHMYPLVYSQSRKKILLNSSVNWRWYNLTRGNFEIYSKGYFVVPFSESLVALDDDNSDDTETEKLP